MKKKHKSPYTRVRGEISPVYHEGTSVYTLRFQNGTSSSTTTLQVPLFDSGSGTVMTDVVTPGYAEMSAKGLIINTPMHRGFEDIVLQPCSGLYVSRVHQYKSPPAGTIPIGDSSVLTNWITDPANKSKSYPDLSIPDTSALYANAVNQAFANSHQRDVMGIVDLGELDKTVDLLRTQLGRFGSAIDAVRMLKYPMRKHKGKLVHMKNVVKKPTSPLGKVADASGLWLEWNYGIVPTMLSIEGLMKVFSEQVLPARQTFRGSDSARGTLQENRVVDLLGSYTGNVIGQRTYSTLLDYNIYCRAGVLTTYQPTTRERLGLTYRDIPSAVYELMPLSFVLDWVYDLGSYIEAATPVPGFSALASWVTQVTERYLTYSHSSSGGRDTIVMNPNLTKIEDYYPISNEQTFIWRHKQRKPNIRSVPPKLDLNFKSTRHAVSGVALSISILSGKLNRRLKL